MIFFVVLVLLQVCGIIEGASIPAVRCPHPCVSVEQCPEANEVVMKSESRRTAEETTMLRRVFCGFQDDQVKVCCEMLKTFKHRNLGLLPQHCGFIDKNRIEGGQGANINEFPWMALISIRMKDGNIAFACGGTVISDRYVLTAAHCVQTMKGAPRAVVGVRVGEHDLSGPYDCQGGVDNAPLVCAEAVQDFGYEEIKVHENYTNDGKIWRHDIALIRLKKKVNFEPKNAKPICLPTSLEQQTRDLDFLTATIPGWGQTETMLESNVLMKADILVHPRDDCALFYEAKNVPTRFRTSTSTFICAGVIGKDSCRRDSGGPLMVPGTHSGFNRYIQYGIVSFGPSECGGDRPSLYTDVVMHMPWILDHLRP